MTNEPNVKIDINIETISKELHVRPEVLKRIITSFAKTLTDKVVQLEDALLKDDAIRARAILHEVRGTSGNLRLINIYDAARILHEAVKANDEKAKLSDHCKILKVYTLALSEFVKT